MINLNLIIKTICCETRWESIYSFSKGMYIYCKRVNDVVRYMTMIFNFVEELERFFL